MLKNNAGVYIFQIYPFPPPFSRGHFFPQIEKGYRGFPKAHFFSPKVFFLNKFFPKPNFFLNLSFPNPSPLFTPPLFPNSFYPPFLLLLFLFFFLFSFSSSFSFFTPFFPSLFLFFSLPLFFSLIFHLFFSLAHFPPPRGGVKMENIYHWFFSNWIRIRNSILLRAGSGSGSRF